MRKAFTLIELMITILIATIFLNFVFRFYSNVLMEVRYLEAKDSLAYNAFRASQIIKNGVYGSASYIGGVVTLKNKTVGNPNFTSYNSLNPITINTTDGNLTIGNGTNFYRFEGLDINSSNFFLEQIGTTNLYLIEFNATTESILTGTNLNRTDTTTYQRLVYTR